jgi:hypothetical protein
MCHCDLYKGEGMTPLFNATTDGSKLIFEAPIRVSNYLRTLKEQKLEVIVRKLRSQRSTLQNNYYFGVVVEILSKHTGYTSDEMHEILKYKFLKVKGKMEYIQSTTKLTTAEFESYLEKIKQWAALDLDCYIPDPNGE